MLDVLFRFLIDYSINVPVTLESGCIWLTSVDTFAGRLSAFSLVSGLRCCFWYFVAAACGAVSATAAAARVLLIIFTTIRLWWSHDSIARFQHQNDRRRLKTSWRYTKWKRAWCWSEDCKLIIFDLFLFRASVSTTIVNGVLYLSISLL